MQVTAILDATAPVSPRRHQGDNVPSDPAVRRRYRAIYNEIERAGGLDVAQTIASLAIHLEPHRHAPSSGTNWSPCGRPQPRRSPHGRKGRKGAGPHRGRRHERRADSCWQLPAAAGHRTQIFAGMARAYDLQVVEQSPAAIIVEGREDDLAAFADRLEQLTRMGR